MPNNVSRGEARSLETGVYSAVRRYGQIFFALMQREQEKRRSAPLESFFDVLEPLALIAFLAVLWSFLNRKSSSPLGDSPVLFIATGFYAKFFWVCIAKMNKSEIGTFNRRFPIERRFDYILVHILFTIADYALLAFMGFGFLYVFFTPKAIPHDFIPVIEGMLAVVALGFGWGMITIAITKFFWPWAYLAGVFNRALVLFSGVFILVEFLPPNARYYLSFNPVMHAIALFRTGFYPAYPTFLLDTTYLTYCSLGAVFIGLVLERVTARYEG